MRAAASDPIPGTTRSLLRGNVLWLSVVSLLNDTASEMIYPLLPLFLVGTLGAGPAFLGVIEGIAESASSFLKLVSGWLSDRFRRRKPLMLAGYAIACAVRPLIAIVTLPWHVLAVRFTDRLGKGMRSAPRDALLAESVSAGMRGRAFGLHRAADHAGAVLGPLVASLLLIAFAGEMRPVFALSIVPGILVVAILVLKVREGRPESTLVEPAAAPANPSPAQPGSTDTDPFLRRSFRMYLLVIAVFTLGNATDAFLLLRAGSLGVSAAFIPLLWGVHHVSKMVWNVVGGILADRFGPRRAIVSGWLVYALVYVGFAFASQPWHVWALFLVYGSFYGLTEAPEKALVVTLARKGRAGSSFGAYHATIGFAALPSSILFGLIWQRFGAHAAFLTGGGLALLAALLLPILVRPGRTPTIEATT